MGGGDWGRRQGGWRKEEEKQGAQGVLWGLVIWLLFRPTLQLLLSHWGLEPSSRYSFALTFPRALKAERVSFLKEGN